MLNVHSAMPVEFVTRIVTGKVPTTEGVPVIWPVELLINNPVGKAVVTLYESIWPVVVGPNGTITDPTVNILFAGQVTVGGGITTDKLIETVLDEVALVAVTI